MSQNHGTFFTSIGCMDGRVQEPIAKYGKEKFHVVYADTITEAGLDGLLSNTNDQNLLESIKKKILISVEKHHSQGIIVHGHEDCAGNIVDENQHISDIKKTVEKIKEMIKDKNIPVTGVYVRFYPEVKIEEL